MYFLNTIFLNYFSKRLQEFHVENFAFGLLMEVLK
jgi:hypothetical protein